MLGINFERLSIGFVQAVLAWTPTIRITGIASGLAGVGSVQGKLAVPANFTLAQAQMQAAGFNGVTSPSLSRVIASIISEVFTIQADYSGVSPLVATGVDTALVAADPSLLIPILNSSLLGSLGSGLLVPSLSIGLAHTVSSLLNVSAGIGVVAGVTTTPTFATSGNTTSTVS
jgi:hypothetical protein